MALLMVVMVVLFMFGVHPGQMHGGADNAMHENAVTQTAKPAAGVQTEVPR